MPSIAPPFNLWFRGGKRACDIAVGSFLFLICLPILLLTALVIKLSSPGPLLYWQARVGRFGSVFYPFKFRTMRVGRQHDPKEPISLEHPDVTPVGRLIRRFKLDELPQLCNVLRGEMSLVGPRPTIPEQVAQYDDFRKERLHVRPGLTGLAQVYTNPAVTSWDERILYDIAYVRHGGFLTDVHILFRTLAVVVCGEQRLTKPFAQSPFAALVEIPEDYFSNSPFRETQSNLRG